MLFLPPHNTFTRIVLNFSRSVPPGFFYFSSHPSHLAREHGRSSSPCNTPRSSFMIHSIYHTPNMADPFRLRIIRSVANNLLRTYNCGLQHRARIWDVRLRVSKHVRPLCLWGTSITHHILARSSINPSLFSHQKYSPKFTVASRLVIPSPTAGASCTLHPHLPPDAACKTPHPRLSRLAALDRDKG